jgi:hypothetical protein
MLFFSLSLLLFKAIASFNDIKNSVSYCLYLHSNLNQYNLISAIAKGGGGVLAAVIWEN